MRRVRPRFRLKSAKKPDEIVALVGDALRAKDCPVSGLAAPGRIELHVHGKEQHLWSPQLIVDLRETKAGTALLARFGPHPSVWTMYVAGYAACGFGMLVGLSFAYAEWVMNEPPWSLLSVPACLVGAAVLYGMAFWGQGAGATQMTKLRGYLEAVVNPEAPRSR